MAGDTPWTEPTEQKRKRRQPSLAAGREHQSAVCLLFVSKSRNQEKGRNREGKKTQRKKNRKRRKEIKRHLLVVFSRTGSLLEVLIVEAASPFSTTTTKEKKKQANKQKQNTFCWTGRTVFFFFFFACMVVCFTHVMKNHSNSNKIRGSVTMNVKT